MKIIMLKKFVNPIVEEKHKAQDIIAKKANYNVHTYTKLIKLKARKIVEDYHSNMHRLQEVAEPKTNYKP